MGLKQLLSDLSNNLEVNSTISNSGNSSNILQQDNGHTINFKQRSIAWPNKYKEGRPLITFGFDGKEFANVGTDGENPAGNPQQESEQSEFMRGGIGVGLARRGQDFVRIGAWMFGTPEGAGWIAKQVGLQFSNPRLNAPQVSLGDSLADQVAGSLSFGGIKDPNQQIYNLGVNTVISTLTAGIGAIPREGAIPYMHSGYIDAGTKRSQWNEEGSIAGDTNRLTHLFNHKIAGGGIGSDLGIPGGDAVAALGGALDKLLGVEGEELFSYIGGPKSKFGIGRTRHGRYVVSNEDNRFNKFNPPTFYSSSLGRSTDPSEIFSKDKPQNFLRIGSIKSGVDKDTHERIWFNYNSKIEKNDQVRTYHQESRLGKGDPGKKSTKEYGNSQFPEAGTGGRIKYKAFIPDKIDKVNALDIHTNTNGSFTDIAYRDLIRFRFEAIDNNKTGTSTSDVMLFRAFIDDVSDNFSAEHNTFKYNGRGEEFYSYKGFKRDISVNFKVAAQSRHEMMPIYRKLNFLVSNTAPDYDGDSGRMRTPYVRLTVGSWMNRIPGVIKSVGLKWQKDYPWEINLTGPEDAAADSDMLVLPHVLDVSISFMPIHNFLPKKGKDTPFILPNHLGTDGAFFPQQQWLKPEDDTTLSTIKTQLNNKPQNRLI